MFYDKDSMKLKKVHQRKYSKAFRTCETGKLLYHYANIDTIWKILNSDCFLARQIRFSNDSEEYKRGEKVIRKYVEEKIEDPQIKRTLEAKIKKGVSSFYIICFCDNGNLLSQWRGYAEKGVSLGFDFSGEEDNQNHVEIFTILNNIGLSDAKFDEKYAIDGKICKHIEMPYKVFYVDSDEKNKELEEAINEFVNSETRISLLQQMVPLIKNDAFVEENEYRIVFDISNMGGTEAFNRRIISKKIKYINKEECLLPNISVEIGDCEKKEECCKRIIIGTKEQTQKMKEIYQIIKEAYEQEYECVINSNMKDIFIDEGNNQERVMEELENLLQSKGYSIDYETGVKIWCKGHLPIRDVIVGPGEHQEKIKKSLVHYMRNTYWLRYVSIRTSDIPLQS